MKRNPKICRLLAAVLAICLCFGHFTVSVKAAGENSAVQDDKNGVVQVVVTVKDKNNDYREVQAGTGFLINSRTVVTCNHVVTLSKDVIDALREINDFSGYKATDIRNRVQIKISVVRDVTINAKIRTVSNDMDIAVLELEQEIADKKSLTLRNSSSVRQTENSYALGFPAIISQVDNITTYTSEDVNISAGKVNKVSAVNTTTGPVDYVISDTKIDSGNSGGPLVDEDGYVIGISQSSVSSSEYDDGYYYSIAIDQLIAMIRPLGISYDLAGESKPEPTKAVESVTEAPTEPTEPTEPPVEQKGPDKSQLKEAIDAAQTIVNGSEYTRDAYPKLKNALLDAQDVYANSAATQSEVEKALSNLKEASVKTEKAGLPMMLIIGIAGGVVLLIIIILVIVLSGKKKSKKAAVPPTPMAPPVAPPPVRPPVNPGPIAGGYGGGGTSVLRSDGSTTVLGAGSSETTVLGGGASFGKLLRKKNGEEITINSPSFKIGRQRAGVDYCITDNTAVGRVHAVISNSGGSTFIVDNNSTNGTFVNGVRVPAGGKTPLNNGDRVALGDEEFVFRA